MNRHTVYLDTARIGQMTIGAKQACDAAQQIAYQSPRLLFQEIVEPTGKLVPYWNGIPAIQDQLNDYFGLGLSSLVASNSAILMKIGAKMLFGSGQRLLVTDLVWKNHLGLLQREAQRTGNKIFVAPVRSQLTDPEFGADQVARFVTDHFIKYQCNSLFLTAVSSDGIRLPIHEILQVIGRHQVRHIVVDGAQEFAQDSVCQMNAYVDAYLFSAHKWLGAWHPLSLMVCGNVQSKRAIETVTRSLVQAGEIHDPLLNLWLTCTQTWSCDHEETVNVMPLVAFAGAIHDLMRRPPNCELRKRNILGIRDLFDCRFWEFRSDWLHPSLQTGVELILAGNKRTHCKQIEDNLASNGVGASVTGNGDIRLSLPISNLNIAQSAIVANALTSL